MENNETPKTKKFNKANLPFLIFVSVFLLTIIFSLITTIFPKNIVIFLLLAFDILLFLLFFIGCPIGLIFQCLHKNKTLFDKILIALNSVVVSISVLLIIFLLVVFPNAWVGEKQVRKQVEQEYEILNKEYKPVLEYLALYKKNYNVYPKTLEGVNIPKSKTFDFYEYNTTYNGKGYWLQVYPINGPIEYYYNDENDNGYNYYNGNGYIDGFLDNDNYYEIDKTWHAIKLDFFTRHSLLWNVGHTERETDEWMKNNADKFEKLESGTKENHESQK